MVYHPSSDRGKRFRLVVFAVSRYRVLIAIIQKHEEKNKKPEKTAMDILKEQQARRMEEYYNTFHMPTDPALICYYEELVKEMGEEEARKYWIEWSKPSIYKRR